MPNAELIETASSTPVRLLVSQTDPFVAELQVCCHDQVGFLFTVTELLTLHGIDIEYAEISTEENIANNYMLLRAPPPVGFSAAAEWCKELETVLLKESKDTVNEEALSKASRGLSVNLDLLSIASFQEVSQLRINSTGQLWYELELQGINQAGLLAYASLMFFRCGFSIQSARISTIDGQVSDTFELVTKSRSSERKLRSFLSVPTSKNKAAARSSMLWSVSENSPSIMDHIEEDEPDKSTDLEEPVFIGTPVLSSSRNNAQCMNFTNGDVYEGTVETGADGNLHREGYGLYTYAMSSHGKYKQYRGQWSNDKKDGFGVLFYRDGSAYVGQWKNNERHGVGILFDTDGNQAQSLMPSYRYEGEWENGSSHGLGIEETRHFMYCGRFDRGQRHRSGMEMLSSASGLAACKVLEGETWRSLSDYVDELEAYANASLPASEHSSSAGSLSEARTKASKETRRMPPTDELEKQYLESLALFPDETTPGASFRAFDSGFSQFRSSVMPMLTPMPDHLATPPVQPRHRSFASSRNASMSTMADGSPEAQALLLSFLQSPVKKASHPQDQFQKSDASSSTAPVLPSPATGRSEGFQNFQEHFPTIEENNEDAASHDPTLWNAAQLATFVRHLGLGEAPVEGVLKQRLKGTTRILEARDAELIQELHLHSPLERLVLRKSLQRLLESEKLAHDSRGQSSRDVLADPVLSAFIIPLEALSLGEIISEGGFGKIYRGVLSQTIPGSSKDAAPPKPRRVAVKQMKGDRQMQLYELLKEARVMASLRHPNICAFVGVCADSGPLGRRYLLSEMLDCSLFDLLHRQEHLSWQGTVTLPLVIKLSAGISSGIAYLHSRNLVHADLKSSNILIDWSHSDTLSARICDFGHSAIRPVPVPHDRICTPHWAAPEVLRGEGLSPAADVFSIGILIWEMLTLRVPHYALSFGQVMAAVGWAGLLPELDVLPPQVPTLLVDAMVQCLSFRPIARPSSKWLRTHLLRIPVLMKMQATESLAAFCTGGF